MKRIYSVIIGTGSYIPSKVVSNTDYLQNKFFSQEGTALENDTSEIIQKFKEITDIQERRHIEDELSTSDLAYKASQAAIEKSGIDPETLDYIIVAHNFGDVPNHSMQTDILPSLASRVKELLGVKNPSAIAYDIIFGCPGWVQAMIQADYFLRSGDAKRALVIGADVLSRLSDPHDRDSMIYADGAGAVILEAQESDTPIGILSHAARTDANGHTYNLFLGKSNNAEHDEENKYIKMDGRKIYNYALTEVPALVKQAMEKADIGLSQVKKVLIHQANAKMDEAILKRLFRLFGEKQVNLDVMPMTIKKLGNSSVATVPTLLDLILNSKIGEHELGKGDIAVFTSVGAGMNINAIVYKFPE